MTPYHTLLFPSDGTSCGNMRMILPGLAVASHGKPVNVMSRPPQITVDQAGHVRDINLGSAKVVIFQRAASSQFQELIPILQDRGITVILDIDDDLSAIEPRNPAHRVYSPHLNHRTNWMIADKNYAMADWVTCTTQALAERYGARGRVTVIPNMIPKSYLTIPRPQNEVPIVCWPGFTSTHVDDLRVTGGMINQVLIDTGASFMAYGDLKIFTDLQIRHRPPHFHQSFTSIKDYPKTLAQADIGLVPLKQSVFNKSKSALKFLEMASLGIVPVGSPSPDNLRLHEMGVGLIAEKPRDWYDRVHELIVDREYREELSKKGRAIAETMTIEENWDLWYSTWQNAYRQANKLTALDVV